MQDPKEQVADVNHFDNKIVVKYEDGTVTLLDGAAVRRHVEERDAPAMAAIAELSPEAVGVVMTDVEPS